MPATTAVGAWPHFVPRLEFDARLQDVDASLGELRGRADAAESLLAALTARVAATEQEGANGRAATVAGLAKLETRIDFEMAHCADELEREVQQLRLHAAPQLEMEATREAHESQLSSLARRAAAVDGELEALAASLKKAGHSSALTFATKAELQDGMAALSREAAADGSALRATLDALKVEKASKTHVQEKHTQVLQNLSALEQQLTLASSRHDTLRGSLEDLEKHCHADLATRVSVEEAARSLAAMSDQIAHAGKSHSSLQSEVQHEREMVRATVYSHQESFKEMNDAISRILRMEHDVRDIRDACARQFAATRALDEREAGHWREALAAHESQRQTSSGLQELHRNFEEAVARHHAEQRTEADRMRQESTKLYFMQMDKALDLKKSIDKMERAQLPPI